MKKEDETENRERQLTRTLRARDARCKLIVGLFLPVTG
jgi:hypothetical protein